MYKQADDLRNNFKVLNFILEGKGADDNQEEVINAIAELKKRVNECENAIIKSKDK